MTQPNMVITAALERPGFQAALLRIEAGFRVRAFMQRAEQVSPSLIRDRPQTSIVNARGKLLVCLLLPLTMFLACTPQDKQSPQVSRPVKVVRIGDAAAADVMSFAGEVRARYETTLAFRVSGKMIDRPVEVGDRVHKGQRVARRRLCGCRMSVPRTM